MVLRTEVDFLDEFYHVSCKTFEKYPEAYLEYVCKLTISLAHDKRESTVNHVRDAFNDVHLSLVKACPNNREIIGKILSSLKEYISFKIYQSFSDIEGVLRVRIPEAVQYLSSGVISKYELLQEGANPIELLRKRVTASQKVLKDLKASLFVVREQAWVTAKGKRKASEFDNLVVNSFEVKEQ